METRPRYRVTACKGLVKILPCGTIYQCCSKVSFIICDLSARFRIRRDLTSWACGFVIHDPFSAKRARTPVIIRLASSAENLSKFPCAA